MRKIIIVVLALIASFNFAVTPAIAEKNIVEKATAEAIETALEAMPEKTRVLARFAYWLGNESGNSVHSGEMAMLFDQVMEHTDLADEQEAFIKAVFRLGSASAVVELEEAEDRVLAIPKDSDNFVFPNSK